MPPWNSLIHTKLCFSKSLHATMWTLKSTWVKASLKQSDRHQKLNSTRVKGFFFSFFFFTTMWWVIKHYLGWRPFLQQCDEPKLYLGEGFFATMWWALNFIWVKASLQQSLQQCNEPKLYFREGLFVTMWWAINFTWMKASLSLCDQSKLYLGEGFFATMWWA